MHKIGVFSLFLSFGIQASAMAPLNVVPFNDGWPSQGEAIPGMPRVTSITSAGPYSWAIGSQGGLQAKIAFYNNNRWQAAAEIPNLPSISRIAPLYSNGETAQAFALGTEKISYFNGETWSVAEPIYSFKNILLAASNGHAFAIANSPAIYSSFFDADHETWSPPIYLSDKINSIRAAATADGIIYLLGLNAQGEVIMLNSSDNQNWHSKNFQIIRPQNMQIVAGAHHLFVAAMNNNTHFFNYSQDDGKTWHEASWSGGMLFSNVSNGILWSLQWDVENKNFSYFNSNLPEPSWNMIQAPAEISQGSIYSDPSPTGTQICITGDSSNGATLQCYDINMGKWQHYPSLSAEANRMDAFVILTNDRFAAHGEDKQGNPALFYYDGAIWQTAHVDGLLASVQNLFINSSRSQVWAIGHN